MTVPNFLSLIKRELKFASSCNQKFKQLLFFIVFLSLISVIYLFIPFTGSGSTKRYDKISLNIRNVPEVQLTDKRGSWGRARDKKCTHWDCFNIYRCGRTGHDRISVYVYPLRKFVDENGVPATETISKDYFALLKTVINSKYYTANPQEACLFIPSIDTLNQGRLRLNLTSKALNSLPYWNNGENHVIFNMIAGGPPDYASVIELNTGNALVAGADFNTYTYRPKFDISIPVLSPFALKLKDIPTVANKHRKWLVISTQINLDPSYRSQLEQMAQMHQQLGVFDACHNNNNYAQRCDNIRTGKKYDYGHLLKSANFCLIFRGVRYGQLLLHEAMAADCIPVIVIDGAVMPFDTAIDWRHAAVFIMENHLGTLMDVLGDISHRKISQMQKTVRFLYNNYFASMEKIVLTALDIVQDRVYPHWGRTYDQINLSPEEKNTNPLFLPITAPKSQGFTAVILTYDRLESLFTLISRLSKVPSLMKVLVVWNHQKKHPPPLSQFPKIQKPINVIRTRANKLSNRFYPYDEIETEAILHIDDDIVMLTSDEVEFAYEVWREFPDRIVGFPSRTHIWDNTTQTWKYESEWTNEISMVLTGAAFLHKYWSYAYTKELPAAVRDWVDEQMNCEDIAMNFLVANVTNKAPIKVTPRKKFKCPECTNNEMLSADMTHMIERSQCVDKFAKAFGRMPLKSVEFRADPVLFKDPFPEKLKRFNDIGKIGRAHV